MIYKPFRPPLLTRPDHKSNVKTLSVSQNAGETSKATTTSKVSEDQIEVSKAPLTSLRASTHKPPTRTSLVLSSSLPEKVKGDDAITKFDVLWRKPSTKKHKTWDGDGVLLVSAGSAHLLDERGRPLGKIEWNQPHRPKIGSELSIGGRIVQIESQIVLEDRTVTSPAAKQAISPEIPKKDSQHNSGHVNRLVGTTLAKAASRKRKHTEVDEISDNDKSDDGYRVQTSSAEPSQLKSKSKQLRHSAPLLPTAIRVGKFRTPLLINNVQERHQNSSGVPVPRHDAKGANALVMDRPSSAPSGKRIVDVVVDPLLTQHLRPHQREGVQFLYRCVMGMQPNGGEGAILADEMGLGKTLQTIALLWTLLKQNPIYEDPPIIRKALIVCPVTLVSNWRNEISKWLGLHRVGVLVVDNDKRIKVSDFTKGKAYRIMIIGYEKLCQIQTELRQGIGIDLVVADEGHRMKSAQSQAAAAIKSLDTEKRIILTGTPMQNNLGEYHALVDLVNPGVLGSASTFKRKFEDVILAGQQPNATTKKKNASREKSQELADTTADFILRRTSEVISNILPQKTEYVLFCRAEPAQLQALKGAVEFQGFDEILQNRQASLQLIHILKQICNCPSLIKSAAPDTLRLQTGKDETLRDVLTAIDTSIPPIVNASSKLRVLDSILRSVRSSHPNEKVVIVSSYTTTLDLIERHLRWSFLRLDGSVPASKRGPLVDLFNRSSADQHFVFLLSAKAGGVGLNLVGANRLVLFDTDWNPATDLQAMARVHRDGQKRPCFIYRLLIMGAMDEKIFQRQVSKMELASDILDSKQDIKTFSLDELRDLFTVDDSDTCQTHRILNCDCGGSGQPSAAANEESPSPPGHCSDASQQSESEEDLPVARFARFKPASKVDFDTVVQERRKTDLDRRKGRNRLMQYAHIDPLKFGLGTDGRAALAGAIEDDVLMGCLVKEEKRPRIAFVFAKGKETL